MSDDLEKLRAALKAVPAPDQDRKARIMATARENFEATQGSADPARPISDRPQGAGRIWTRIVDMVSQGISRPVLMATSSLAVIALAVVIVDPIGLREGAVLDGGTVTSQEVRPEPDDAAMGVEAEESRAAPMAADPVPMVLAEPAPAQGRVRRVQENIGLDSIAAAPKVNYSIAPQPDMPRTQITVDDRFPDAELNGLKVTAEAPVSTFSVDVDTTSYALWRMSVLDGYPLPPEAIRVEEMINYFNYAYQAPDRAEVPFSTSIAVSPTPWNEGTRLMQIGIQGYDVASDARPPMGLVFLIDTSGSMEDPMKLPLLIKSFTLLLNSLGEEDTVAIVTYAGSAGTVLEPTSASERDTIMDALTRLSAGGSTAGQAGLQQAYGIAEDMVENGQSARVILATDGDFNVGISDPDALTDYVAEKRETGVALSVLGFGRGNYTDTIMQALAQNGDGVAAYIDSLAEAQKVLVEDVTGTLMTIASDVKIQVEFNPAQISEYRLIGYETRALNREDFNNDAVDAGDIGAGHSVTAIYEVTPKGSPAELVDPLRYGDASAGGSDEWAHVKLRYKLPGEADSRLIETPVDAQARMIGASERNFAAAVAGAGRLIRGETLGDWSLEDAAALAAGSLGDDPFGYRAEFLRLVRLAAAQK